MKAEQICAIRMFAPIQAGDSFTVIRRFVKDGAWAQVSAQVACPRTGFLGIVTHRFSPKDWSPKGIFPKNFTPLARFDAAWITLVHNGNALEFSEPLEPGSVGVFVDEKAKEEVPVPPAEPELYEDVESDD